MTKAEADKLDGLTVLTAKIAADLGNIRDDVTEIKEQAIKTNGRVTEQEARWIAHDAAQAERDKHAAHADRQQARKTESWRWRIGTVVLFGASVTGFAELLHALGV